MDDTGDNDLYMFNDMRIPIRVSGPVNSKEGYVRDDYDPAEVEKDMFRSPYHFKRWFNAQNVLEKGKKLK